MILAFGAYFARFVAAAVTTLLPQRRHGRCRATGPAGALRDLVFVILIALDQLGLGDIIRQTFLIIIAAVALGLALAFGIGGAKRAGELLERWSRRPASASGAAGTQRPGADAVALGTKPVPRRA